MISISCSALESARVNPKALAQQMLSKGGSRGSRGMFTSWQDHIRSIHSRDIEPAVAFMNLQQSFLRFASNPMNYAKQEYLLDHFYPYLDKVHRARLSYLESKRRMKWYLVTDSKLGGELPYIFKNETGFVAFYFTEKDFNWKTELRFPIIQRYLSANHLGCDERDIQVGVYSLEQNAFKLQSYSNDVVEAAINETKGVILKVIEEYNRV